VNEAQLEADIATRNEARLEAWERRMSPVIIVAAILPIVVGLTERGQSEPAVWLDLASWAVFIADFVVHLAWRRGFLRSGVGKFDLVIVVLTAPWYLIPGLGGSRVLGLARLGRLGRIFVVSTKSPVLRDLSQRLGRAALYGLALMMCCALVVKAVEPPSAGFEGYGDAMWWAMVTFTTVGYGDYFPVTTAGRIAAVLLMLGGIALIGTLAGSLGSYFTAEDESHDAADTGAVDQALLEEIRSLRREIDELRRSWPPAN
jgi:voltage-gated potassium channel